MGQYNRQAGPSGRNQFGITEGDLAALRDNRDTERNRVAQNRKYFESGCLCLKNGLIEMKSQNTIDALAVEYYEQNCTCSRNYIETK